MCIVYFAQSMAEHRHSCWCHSAILTVCCMLHFDAVRRRACLLLSFPLLACRGVRFPCQQAGVEMCLACLAPQGTKVQSAANCGSGTVGPAALSVPSCGIGSSTQSGHNHRAAWLLTVLATIASTEHNLLGRT